MVSRRAPQWHLACAALIVLTGCATPASVELTPTQEAALLWAAPYDTLMREAAAKLDWAALESLLR